MAALALLSTHNLVYRVTQLKQQLQRHQRRLLTLGGVGLVVIGLVPLISFVSGHPISDMTRDPAAVTNSEFYIGLLSNLGILLWAATAAICAYTANLLDRRRAVFFWCWALATAVLGADDLFLGHERLFPQHLGIPQPLVLGLLLGMVITALAVFARAILETQYLLLSVALGLFALSVGLDVFFEPGEVQILFEDGFKFLGILYWLTYFADTGRSALQARATPR